MVRNGPPLDSGIHPISPESSHSERRLKRHSWRPAICNSIVHGFTLQLGMMGLGFLSGAALARQLGPADRGWFQVAGMIYGMAAPVLGFGLGSSLTGRESPPWPRTRVFGWVVLVGWLIACAIVAFAPWPLPMRMAIILLLPGCLLSPISEALLQRLGLSSKVQLLRFIDVGGSSLCVVAVAVTGSLNLLTATLCLFGVTLLLRSWILFRLWKRELPSPTPKNMPSLSNQMRRYWPWDVIVSLSMFTDIAIGLWYLPVHEVGLYAVALAIGKLASAPFSALVPRVVGQSRALAENNGRFIGRSTAIACAIALIGGLLYLAVGRPLTTGIYGEAFEGSFYPAAVLLLAFTITGVTTHAEAWALGRGGRLVSAAPRAIAAGLTLGGAVVVGELFGITLVRLATLTLCMSLLTALLTVHRLFRLRAE